MKRWTLAGPVAVFLICFIAYLHTMNPAFRADDSPETMAACVTLGIQHPPAYPLHTLVGRCFSLLPAGAVAFRINLMAAFFGALTCALLAASLQQWLRKTEAQDLRAASAGALAGVLLGLSKTFWSQSLAAKGGIYTLHSAFMTGLLLCLVLWSQDAVAMDASGPGPRSRLLSSRWFLLAVFLVALGFGNHWETQALLVPATLALAAFVWRGAPAFVPAAKALPKKGAAAPSALASFPLKLILWPFLLVILGLSVYAYLPLRASHDPFLNWGAPRNWEQFWWVFQRQEYLDLEVGFLKSLRAALFGAGAWKDVAENWVFVQRQGLRVLGYLVGPQADLGWPNVLLALTGAFALGKACFGSGEPGWSKRQARPLAIWMLALGGSVAFVVTFYFHLKAEMVWILDVFLIPAYIVQAGLAGIGAYKLLEGRGKEIIALPFVVALALFAWRADGLTQARHYIAYDYGKDLLLSAKRNAVIFAEGDFNTMPVYYLQQVAHKRPDVDHVTTVFLSTDWGVVHARKVQPRLTLGPVPKAITGARSGDGQVLRSALGQIAQGAVTQGRPLQASWFRQVQAENVAEWEPGFHPSGILCELNGPQTPAEDLRRQGLIKALRTRHLEFDRAHLDPSPEFALSNYGTAYLELANYLRLHGAYAASLPYYTKAALVSTRSNLAEIYTHHGIALASGGPGGKPAADLAGAAVLFRQALQVKPLFEAYANLAGICNQLGQKTKQVSYYLEAEANAKQAVTLAPTSGAAWNNLAIAQYYQNRQTEALATLRRALEYSPNDPQILANLRALGG